MLIVAAAVFCLALSAPTVSADPRITQPLFYGWIVIAIALFIASFFVKKKYNEKSRRISCSFYFK